MLHDKSISPKAKGVLCYLLSLPNDWEIHLKQVAEAMGVGKDQIYSAFDEMIANGYASKTEIAGEKGQFSSIHYEISEHKNLNTEAGNPPGGPGGFSVTGNPPILSNDIPNTQNKSVCANPGPVAPSLHENVKKMKPDGTSFEVCRDDLIRLAVQTRQDWTIDEIDALWAIIYDYPNPIRELIPFCEGTVKNCRKMSAIKKVKEKEESCKTKKSSQKKESDSKKKEYSDQDFKTRPFANWKFPNGPVQQ